MTLPSRLVVLALALGALTACAANTADVEALEKRVNVLERRVRTLEGGAPLRGKAKGKARPPLEKPGADAPRRTGTIEVAGAAVVALIGGDNTRHPVPGKVPTGNYSVFATFGDEEPVKAGSLDVVDGVKHVLTCDATTKRCTAD